MLFYPDTGKKARGQKLTETAVAEDRVPASLTTALDIRIPQRMRGVKPPILGKLTLRGCRAQEMCASILEVRGDAFFFFRRGGIIFFSSDEPSRLMNMRESSCYLSCSPTPSAPLFLTGLLMFNRSDVIKKIH